MALHARKHPGLDVEGCFGCKVAHVGVMSVPGGNRPGGVKATSERKFKKDMEAYYNARKAGETPQATTVEGVRKSRIKRETYERVEAAGLIEETSWKPSFMGDDA